MDDEPLISISDAAKRIGVNKSTLSRQIKTGSIRSHRGKVLFSEVLEDRAANIDLTHSRRTAGAGPVSVVVDDNGADFDESDQVEVDGVLLPFSGAQRLKENYLAKLRKLEFEIKSGVLIDADAARSAVFALARGDRDSLMNWPARVAPLIAAELGCDQVALAVVLEKHVRNHLSERANPELRIKG